MKEIKLKPCPFCGGTNIKVKGTYKYCKCMTCGATSGGLEENKYALDNSGESAIKAWNARKPIEKVVEQIQIEGKVLPWKNHVMQHFTRSE